MFQPILILLVVMLAGCASTETKPEMGPDGTIAYYVEIESNEAGARVEVNEDHVGITPIKIRVWGDKDGTFHNFGTSDFVIKVTPARDGYVQTKVFRTGGWFAQEDRVPTKLYFDLKQKREEGAFTSEPGKPRY
jgi:hypothetical protein